MINICDEFQTFNTKQTLHTEPQTHHTSPDASHATAFGPRNGLFSHDDARIRNTASSTNEMRQEVDECARRDAIVQSRTLFV